MFLLLQIWWLSDLTVSGQDLIDKKTKGIIVPLKAIVGGETIIGPDLSQEEWTKLKLQHRNGLPIIMGCCGAPGHLRMSKTGTQHFYHAVDTGCNYEQESREHLEIKYQIYRTCKFENWETYVEFPAPDRHGSRMYTQSRKAGKLFLRYKSAPFLRMIWERQEIPERRNRIILVTG